MSTLSTDKLKDKVAIVTASTDGIGLAIARRLAQDGAKVMLSSRKQTNVDKAVRQLKAENLDVSGMVCHVGIPDHRKQLIEQTISHFGGIDILVSNAAVNPYLGPIVGIPEGAWDKLFDINLKVPLLLTRDVLPHMKKRGGGSVVLVSSIVGYYPRPPLSAYGITKTALFGLTKALSIELATDNVRVNCLAPGLIKTRFSSVVWNNDEVLRITNLLPLKRIGLPDECSGAVSFLVSNDASYITGETIVVAGGATSRL